MDREQVGRRMRQELRGVLKLIPLVLAALVLAVLLWSADSAALSGLFQSSPVDTPTATLAPSDTPSPEPTETLAATPEITATATITITETAVPLETATEALPTATEPPTATPVPTEPPVVEEPAEPVETEETSDESLRYPEGESELRFEWNMLFDALALFFSYIWLICGVLLFLAVPVLLYFLWKEGERRQAEDQDEGEGDNEAEQEDEEAEQSEA